MPLELADGIEYIKVEEDGFLLFLDTGRLERLNPVGSFILEQLQEGRGEDELVTAVQSAFEGAEEKTVMKDVDDFLRDMRETGILLRKG